MVHESGLEMSLHTIDMMIYRLHSLHLIQKWERPNGMNYKMRVTDKGRRVLLDLSDTMDAIMRACPKPVRLK